jgi:NADH dehydrogenase/NADH:ubiquinone oxidoreductase subunit G
MLLAVRSVLPSCHLAATTPVLTLLTPAPGVCRRCIECGQCVSLCPVGALIERSEWREVLELLHSRGKVLVAQTAPAVRVAIGEEAGLAPGELL